MQFGSSITRGIMCNPSVILWSKFTMIWKELRQWSTTVHWCMTVLLSLYLIGTVAGENDRWKGTTMSAFENNGGLKGNSCNSNMVEKCWERLPTMEEPRIPTTLKEVETACKAFGIGMECVDNYSQQCLNSKQRQQLKSSVRGAHETFTLLCKDEKFKAEFLSHANCTKKISRKWDDCSSHFINALKKADQRLAVCCIRLRFLQCVSEVANIHCTRDDGTFLEKIAVNLAKSNPKSKIMQECSNVSYANCSQSSGACSPRGHSMMIMPSMFSNLWKYAYLSVCTLYNNLNWVWNRSMIM